MKNEDGNENEYGLFYWWKSGVIWKMVVLFIDSDRFMKIRQTRLSVGNDLSIINGFDKLGGTQAPYDKPDRAGLELQLQTWCEQSTSSRQSCEGWSIDYSKRQPMIVASVKPSLPSWTKLAFTTVLIPPLSNRCQSFQKSWADHGNLQNNHMRMMRMMRSRGQDMSSRPL